MKKFLKFLKVFVIVCLVLGALALVGCYIAIPEQTKNAIDIVMEYVNRPLPIIGVSLLTIGGVIYFIFSKTSFGKKSLNAIRSEFKDFTEETNHKVEVAKEYCEKAEQTKEEIKAILGAYTSEIDNLTNYLVKVCETSPNVKINAIGKEITDKINGIKTTLNEELSKIDTNIKEYVEEKVNVKELKEQILALEELVKGLGVHNGEETTND